MPAHRTRRRGRRPEKPVVADALFAAALTLFLLVVEPVVARAEGGFGTPGWVLIVVGGGAFVVRSASPRALFVVTFGAMTAWLALRYPGGPIYLTAIGGTVALALAEPMRRALPLVAAGLVVWLATASLRGMFEAHMLLVYPAWLGGAALLAEAQRARRDRVQAQQAQAVAEERLRIARDVHDVVGHSLATISLQAGVAEHLLESEDDVDQARAALRTIRQVSRQSLGELSAMLGVLRGEAAAERAPTPSLNAIGPLVERMREAGLRVDVELPGCGAAVPEVVGVAGYRIVQEALTNVVRHAGAGARAHVRVVRDGDAVELEVRDDGRGAREGLAEGSGLLGMRERAAAVGGTVEATPDLLGGGFRVRARLPIGVGADAAAGRGGQTVPA